MPTKFINAMALHVNEKTQEMEGQYDGEGLAMEAVSGRGRKLIHKTATSRSYDGQGTPSDAASPEMRSPKAG